MTAAVNTTPRLVKNCRSFQRARDPFPRRVLVDRQRRADFGQAFLFEKPQQHRLPVLRAQAGQRLIQQRRHQFPG